MKSTFFYTTDPSRTAVCRRQKGPRVQFQALEHPLPVVSRSYNFTYYRGERTAEISPQANQFLFLAISKGETHNPI